MKRLQICLMVLQLPVDVAMLFFAALSAYQLRFADWVIEQKVPVFQLTQSEFLLIAIKIIPIWILLFALNGLYTVDPNRKITQALNKIILGCSSGVAFVAMYVLFTNEQFDSRFLVVASWLFAIVYVSIGHMLMRGVKAILYRLGVGLRRVVVIGDGEVAQSLIQFLKTRKEFGYAVVGQFSGFTSAVKRQLTTLVPDELLFTNPRSKEKETLSAIAYANEHHLVFKYTADLFSTFTTNMSVQPLAGVPVVEIRRTPLDGWGRVVKRLFDIIVSLFVMLIGSPLYCILAFVILLETGLPIVYKNQRVGIRSKRFTMFKFRSMYQKDSTGPQFGESGKLAEVKEQALIQQLNSRKGPIYKVTNDPRVTPVGRWLRRYSLDELPQFWNVFIGEMSVVGPRPHQPREVEQYEKEHTQVFALKPGITGLAQISGRSDLTFEEEMRLDVLYIEKWSVWLDLVVCMKTPFILFKKRKAL